MKPIPKTLRESNRYISFTIQSSKQHSYDAVAKAITETAVHLIGILGASKIQLQLISDQYKYPNGLLKTNAAGSAIARTILGCVAKIDDEAVAIKTNKTSGEITNVRIAPKPDRFKLKKQQKNKTAQQKTHTKQ